jgi:two-component system, sensor histidine kinase
MNIENAIRIEQARIIHSNLPTASLGGLVVLGLVVFVFRNSVSPASLIPWTTAAVLLNGFRMWQWWQFRSIPFDDETATRWLNHAIVGAACSGGLWGAGAFFFVPSQELDYQLTFVYAVVMMSVASMFSYSPYYRCFVAFSLPCALPIIPAMALQGTEITWSIAAGITIFLAVSMRFMWSFSKMFRESLRLRFENAGLIGALTEQKETAETANMAKSRFLAAASHDLRQPMHALNLYMGAFDDGALSARGKAILGNMRECGRAMDEMFRALLDISRLDAGSVQPQMRPFDMDSILDRLRSEFEPQAKAKGLEFSVAPCAVNIYSDPAMVERVLRNFVANAVMHSERGRILVGCRRRRPSIRVAVYDTGPGIAADQHEKIFDEFYQAGNPERDRSKGLGLGLAIVARLARLIEAPITLRSRPGEGSMFAIELERSDRTAAPGPGVVESAQSLRGLHAVVIDDEAAILDATQLLLNNWGCKVTVAGSLAEALLLLGNSKRAPDLLLCDYRLREGETGVRAVEGLRAEFNADIPAVLITGDTDAQRLRDIEASGLPLLHKPLNESELRGMLARLLLARAA